jgi:hypothetical protein
MAGEDEVRVAKNSFINGAFIIGWNEEFALSRKTVLSLALSLLLMSTFSIPFETQSVAHAGPWMPLSTHVGALIPVPFSYQEQDYYCGPAALQMVFSYYGENISQSEIACVARSIGDPLYVTYTDELRRAGQFSNVSTSMGDELPSNITGYTLRQLGYAAFDAHGMDLTTLRSFLDQGKPLILLMWYSSHHVSTHFRVAVGYNSTHVFLHDPWNKPLWGGMYGGPDIAFNNSEFLDLWSYYGYWALYVTPWAVSISAPSYVEPGTPFQIVSAIVYPQPLPNSMSTFPASSCNASIALYGNLSLVQGEIQKKTVGTGLLQAGNSSVVSWALVAGSYGNATVNVTVEGTISGSVGTQPPPSNYTAYSYTDRIGATVNFTVTVTSKPRDVAVSAVMLSKTVIGQGYPGETSVTVINRGQYAETFNVTAYANATVIGTQQVDNLNSTGEATLVFTWNTTGLPYGNYTLNGYAWPLPNEADTSNNNLTAGTVQVTIPGDVNGDFRVNLIDLVILANAYGSTPSDIRWNPNADIDGNAAVGNSDLVILATHYGEPHPP